MFGSYTIKTHIAIIACCYCHSCALNGLRFCTFAHKDSRFVLLFNLSFIYVLFVLKHTQFDVQ